MGEVRTGVTLVNIRDTSAAVREPVKTIWETTDTKYLNAIPGMADSIKEGIETPASECVPLSSVWPDV